MRQYIQVKQTELIQVMESMWHGEHNIKITKTENQELVNPES